MTNLDGGYTALAGYLYQTVALLGMIAQANCSNVATDTEEMEAILELMHPEGEVSYEHLDQDAVIHKLGINNTNGSTFVQFKYSRQASPPTISQDELIDIVKALYKGEEKAQNMEGLVTGHILVTNRRLGPEAQELKAAAEQGHYDHPELYKKRRYRREILKQLIVVTPMSMNQGRRMLTRFAEELGCLKRKQEITSGINELIGYIFHQSGDYGSASVTKADLLKAFTKSPEARSITPQSIVEYSSHEVERFPCSKPSGLVRREKLDEIAKKANKRALVILHGLGGCGKTITLWQWAKELVTPTSPDVGAFTAIEPADYIPECWIADLVCKWGNLNPAKGFPRCKERHQNAIERLLIANRDLPHPILHLGLDGLDEEIGAKQQETIKNILRWFWEEDKTSRAEGHLPRATLVVTCREVEELEKWLRLDVSGFSYEYKLPDVEIDIFTPEELTMAAYQTRQLELFHAIKNALPELTLPISFPNQFASASPVSYAVDDQIIESLRHPAMWRSLLEFGNEEEQLRALAGDPQAAEELACIFVRRFWNKLYHRGQNLDLEEEELHFILHKIALSGKNNQKIKRTRKSWIDEACATDLVRDRGAERLYKEADSGGLIRKENIYWRWRHKLVWDYLAKNETV